jgi:glutamyl-tRNA synthetase
VKGRTRIAPTPSGFIHRGNAINFLLVQLIARRFGIPILLRIDDLDKERIRPEYLQDVFRSLEWLGMKWDEGPRDVDDHLKNWSQGQRMEGYLKILEALRNEGHLYGCTCTRSVLSGSVIYPGHCRNKGIALDDPCAAWRIRVAEHARVAMRTMTGEVRELDVPTLIGDVVLRQRSADGGRPAYQIASLADDVNFGITHIVRGDDLLPSTAIQLYIEQVLDLHDFLKTQFLHHPLVTDREGKKLSKSAGVEGLQLRMISDPSDLRKEAEALYSKYFS